MEISNEIENMLEKALKTVNREKLKQEAINLSKRYCEEERNNQSFISSKETALAYAIIRMPATYGAVKTVLQELKERVQENEDSNELEIKTILDLGAGTGAATIALSEEFPEAQITCIEREEEMISLGKKFLLQMEKENVEWKKQDILQNNINKQADLIIESYLTNEWKRRRYQKDIFKDARKHKPICNID